MSVKYLPSSDIVTFSVALNSSTSCHDDVLSRILDIQLNLSVPRPSKTANAPITPDVSNSMRTYVEER